MDNWQEYLERNLKFIQGEMGWSQSRFAAEMNTNKVAINHYLTKGRVPSIDFLFKLCEHREIKEKGMRFQISDLFEENFDPYRALSQSAIPSVLDWSAANHAMVGNYLLYFANATGDLCRAVLSVYADFDRELQFVRHFALSAFFTAEEGGVAERLKASLDASCKGIKAPVEYAEAIRAAYSDYEKHLYIGSVEIEQYHVRISLENGNLGDSVTLLFRAPQNALVEYKGSLAGMVTSLCEDGYVPCAGKAILSKRLLQNYSDEVLLGHLSMYSKRISLDEKSLEELCDFCGSLYSLEGVQIVSKEDKQLLLRHRLERFLKNYISCRSLAVASVESEDDRAMCEMIVKSR